MLLLVATGCTVKKADTLTPGGPSEFGLSLTLQANPDVLTLDGTSQSQIVVQARGPNSQPMSNVGLRIEVTVNGVVVDYGRLSSKNAVTGGDGRATVTYTAPQGTYTGNTDSGQNIVTIQVIPSGYDYSNAFQRTVNIRLVPLGVIVPPVDAPGAPKPAFTYSPSSPTEEDVIQFDASGSTDDGRIVTYQWDFGDGQTGSGIRTTKDYELAGRYTVTLTVTDDAGFTARLSKEITVAVAPAPTASFTASPTSAELNQSVFFNGSASRPGQGRTIVAYEWTFGDGGTAGGVTTSHRYTRVGNFTVTLTVTDDAGKTATASSGVTVSQPTGGSALFTTSPSTPRVGQQVFYNAAGSTPSTGKTITDYTWDFGDGSFGTGQTTSHVYGAAGSYTVVLTITDNSGSKYSTSKSITIVP